MIKEKCIFIFTLKQEHNQLFSFKNMHYKSVANHKHSDNINYGMGQR